MPKQIIIPELDGWDEQKEEFVSFPKTTFVIEHSLISIAKWEEKWNIAFLKKTPQKTAEQLLDYIRCMTLTQNVDPMVYTRLTSDIIDDIFSYVNAPHSATFFPDDNLPKAEGATPTKDVVTSELIYYWMFSYRIPLGCQKWHLNRLLNLIKIFNKKGEEAQPNKRPRMSTRQLMSRNQALNAARRTRMNSRG